MPEPDSAAGPETVSQPSSGSAPERAAPRVTLGRRRALIATALAVGAFGAAWQKGVFAVSDKQWPAPPAFDLDGSKKYTATIKTSLGDMTADLFVGDAPQTANNFVFLAREGFYDGVIFHRIISGFMVQTGDPTGTGRGGPGYRFKDELTGPQGYGDGTLAMANAGPNTQGSQFFICHGSGAARLPKAYTIFGQVTSGLDVLNAIATVPVKRGPTGENSTPVDPPTISTIEIAEA